MRFKSMIFLFFYILIFSKSYSQSNLPDWIASRQSPANVGYVSSIVIPVSWPTDFGGGILIDIINNTEDDQIDNIIIEVYNNQIPRQLRNTLSFSGTYGSNPTTTAGVFSSDSLVYKAISQQGNNDCATISGSDNYYIDDGINVFNGYKCVGTLILPVGWLKTPYAIRENNQTQITWSVAYQINNEKYIIEHSTPDSYREALKFSPIGEIAGDGTSKETKHYEYTHTSPSIGINYYRIKQMDYDGKHSYSDIASVRYYGNGETNIYPNPTTSEVTITTTASTSLQVMDVFGRLLKRQDISEGQNTLNLSALPSGILIFVVGDQRYRVFKK